MSLDEDAPDNVVSVLTTAATAYQESAVRLPASWEYRQIPMIWAAIASELDLAALEIESPTSSGSTRRRPPVRRKE